MKVIFNDFCIVFASLTSYHCLIFEIQRVDFRCAFFDLIHKLNDNSNEKVAPKIPRRKMLRVYCLLFIINMF